ncbi:MAG: hypothetical protein ACWA5Q_08930 [bacterium]
MVKTQVLLPFLTLVFVSTNIEAETLSGQQIQALLSNQTYDIEKIGASENKKHLSAYTAADGTRVVYIPWKNKKSTRKWWVEGDKLCLSHPKKADFCRNIKQVGGVYHSVEDGKSMTVLSNFREGNQL